MRKFVLWGAFFFLCACSSSSDDGASKDGSENPSQGAEAGVDSAIGHGDDRDAQGTGGNSDARGTGGGNVDAAGTGGARPDSGAGGNPDSGRPDASSVRDSAPSDGANGGGCQGSTFLLCEDFESTAIGAIPSGWTKTGQASVTGDQFHRGGHALQAGVATNGPRRINRSLSALGANASSHWGRIFYKVKMPAPTYNGYLHSTLIALQGKSPVDGIDIEARVVDTVQGPQNTHQFLYNVQPSGRNEFGTGSDYNWKYDGDWHCAEWHVDYATQSYNFFIDGAEVMQIRIKGGAGNYANVEIPMAYGSIAVGWNNYQVLPSGSGFEAYLDDLAINDAQVGCN